MTAVPVALKEFHDREGVLTIRYQDIYGNYFESYQEVEFDEALQVAHLGPVRTKMLPTWPRQDV